MTIGQYLNKNHPDFRRWKILAHWYHFLYRITGKNEWFVKAVEYMDKRWELMMELLEHQ